jgi:hypothetical protein
VGILSIREREITMTTYYKFLTGENKGEYSGFDYSDYLPRRGKPGKWLPKIKELYMCESGYHVCLKKDLQNWLNDDLYVVEIRGGMIDGDDKVAAEQMRFIKKVEGWNKKNLRLAAVEIVRRIALPVWKKNNPDDTEIKKVLGVVKRYANGNATDNELAAAWDAARAAAWDAARDAARAAAWDAARDAARAAARAAAWDAAWDAARAAARDAAYKKAIKIIYKQCGL